MTLYKWSATAATNATADATINWAEGQAPSSVNDSARAMMAAVAKYRDDISGKLGTGGTSAAYTIGTNEVYDTLANLQTQMIAFTPHVTNAANCTLNVDGLGAKQIVSGQGIPLVEGSLIVGTPYVVMYRNDFPAFVLQGGFSNPYNIPLGAGMDFWGNSPPNSAFAFATGQAISRVTYAPLFALFGTTFGAGDGSTTFNIPDKRGRVSAAFDSGAGRLLIAGSLGATGGSETHVITIAELPSHTHTGTTGVESATHTHPYTVPTSSGGQKPAGTGTAPLDGTATANTGTQSANHTHPFTTDATGSGVAHSIAQPTITCNYIIRVI